MFQLGPIPTRTKLRQTSNQIRLRRGNTSGKHVAPLFLRGSATQARHCKKTSQFFLLIEGCKRVKSPPGSHARHTRHPDRAGGHSRAGCPLSHADDAKHPREALTADSRILLLSLPRCPSCPSRSRRRRSLPPHSRDQTDPRDHRRRPSLCLSARDTSTPPSAGAPRTLTV